MTILSHMAPDILQCFTFFCSLHAKRLRAELTGQQDTAAEIPGESVNIPCRAMYYSNLVDFIGR